MENATDGCKVCIHEWGSGRGGLHEATSRLYEKRRREEGVEAQEGIVRLEVGYPSLE